MGRGQSTARFLVCEPDADPDHWEEVDAYDHEEAAEKAAERACARDPANYRDFEDGVLMLVKGIVEKEPKRFNVTVEAVPSFHARPKRS